MPLTRKLGSRLSVGLMSGTSLDGIDAALVRISGEMENPKVKLLAFRTYPYPINLQAELLNISEGGMVSASTLSDVNFRLGILFGNAVTRLCRSNRVKLSSLHCIASHGQTVFHLGHHIKGKKNRGQAPSTLQLGEPSLIAGHCKVTTVADFRPADMGQGGEGAPLVPLIDYLLFRKKKLGTITLNLGGIANITIIPPNSKESDVFGFDTGPGNMVIDALVRLLTHGKKLMDRNGCIASRGCIVPQILKKSLSHPFLRLVPPKSAGREEFGSVFVEKFLKSKIGIRPQDLIATATELTVTTIVNAINQFVLPVTSIERIIISGGGAHNKHLMHRLGVMLPNLRLHKSGEFGIPEDAKEAISFALLAERTLAGLPGNIPAATGATRPVPLGKIIYA